MNFSQMNFSSEFLTDSEGINTYLTTTMTRGKLWHNYTYTGNERLIRHIYSSGGTPEARIPLFVCLSVSLSLCLSPFRPSLRPCVRASV